MPARLTCPACDYSTDSPAARTLLKRHVLVHHRGTLDPESVVPDRRRDRAMLSDDDGDNSDRFVVQLFDVNGWSSYRPFESADAAIAHARETGRGRNVRVRDNHRAKVVWSGRLTE